MSYTIGILHETNEGRGYIDLEFDGVSVRGGRPARLNPPRKAHPAEPPTVTFDEVEIIEDELDRGLKAIEVFEHHDTDILDELLKKYGRKHHH